MYTRAAAPTFECLDEDQGAATGKAAPSATGVYQPNQSILDMLWALKTKTMALMLYTLAAAGSSRTGCWQIFVRHLSDLTKLGILHSNWRSQCHGQC